MVALNPGDRKQLLSLLEKLPDMATERSRRQLLIDAELGKFVSRIDLSGASQLVASAIVSDLEQFGRDPKMEVEVLGLLLTGVRDRVGAEQQIAIDSLLREYRMMEAIPSDNEPARVPTNLDRRGILDPNQFVGRETQLKELHDRLAERERIAITGVVGMGGVGKTELAVQYARRHMEDYRGGVVWLSGPQAVTDLLSFARQAFLTPAHLAVMAEMKTAEEQVRFCWMHWPAKEKPPESVLLVFDDVTDYRQQVMRYLPEDKRFRVLLTTRERFQGIDRLDLDVLDPADALALLGAIVGEERIAAEAETAAALCVWLGYLPLGLELVGCYLVEEQCSLLELLGELERRKNLKHPALQDPEPAMTAQHGVEAAFELSWERLDIDARFLGAYMSLFAEAPIPWSLIVEPSEASNEAHDALKAARRKLVRFSLLQRLGRERFQYHPLVRRFFAEKRDSDEFVMPPKHQMTGATSQILQLFGAP